MPPDRDTEDDRMSNFTPARPRHRRTALMAGALAIGLSLVGVGPALAAPSVSSVTLTVSPTTLEVGDTVVASATLVATADVFAYEVTFSFDEDIFEYVDGSATGPEGGFDAATEAPGTVTITHTRLGTSPTLSGDIALTAEFLSIGDGETGIEIPTVTLFDSEGGTTPLTDVASSEELTVEPIEVVQPSPSPSPSTSASPSPTTAPTDEGGPLAFTGSTIGGSIAIIVLAALAALALGIVLVRRRIASTR